ncbi:MAG: flavodoxin family protein [Deltaproteobacteria bacterium]|jgi:multimeric flavodoxin WrbA|nr:flavodoxin family protein [Deltaproteobacteria bacterium]
MTVLAVNGSPRKGGNTSIMLGWVLEEIEKEGFRTELFQVGGENVRGCRACGGCGKLNEYRCVQDDAVNVFIKKARDAEALVIGSPVYFSDITPETKCVIDRLGFVDLNNGNALRRKPGAAVVVARRAGHVHSYDSINHLFGITQMLTVGSRYWNLGVALEEGSVSADQEARDTMRVLGQNMAWLLKKLGS